jgi:hypothetical protein
MGDWNTGAHHADEKGKTFVCAEHFNRLVSNVQPAIVYSGLPICSLAQMAMSPNAIP